jgi:hypothetical protein
VRVDEPRLLPGFGEVLAGPLHDTVGTIDDHSLRIRGVTSVFPSITLASWASIFSGEGPQNTRQFGNEFFDRYAAANGGDRAPNATGAPPGMISYSGGGLARI